MIPFIVIAAIFAFAGFYLKNFASYLKSKEESTTVISLIETCSLALFVGCGYFVYKIFAMLAVK